MPSSAPIKLSIRLKDAPLSIARRILVPNDIDLRQLHHVFQIAMGWTNSHLFEFYDTRGRGAVGATDPETAQEDASVNVAGEMKLSRFLKKIKKPNQFTYEYDFGDGWEHKISVLKTSKKDLILFEGPPICVMAEGACPPEDVGGVYGYTEFLDIMNDTKTPDHAEMREWIGLKPREKWDPTAVNLKVINKELKVLFQSGTWTDQDEYGWMDF